MNDQNLQNIPGIGPNHNPKPGISSPQQLDMNPSHGPSQLQTSGFGRDISHTGDNPIPYHDRYLSKDLPKAHIRKPKFLKNR